MKKQNKMDEELVEDGSHLRKTSDLESFVISAADLNGARSCTPSDDLKDPTIEVRCGHLSARLHLEKFVCPGIHQACIEMEGELISPKEFTIRANKDKQKDWKGSIRIGKSNMRALMEMKSLDFYNHDNYCSAKCQSRNYVASRTHFTDAFLRGDQLFSHFDKPDSDESEGINGCSTSGITAEAATANSSFDFLNTNFPDLMSTIISNTKVEEETNQEGDEGSVDSNGTLKIINTQPVKFWSVMSEMGLLNDVLDIVKNSLHNVCRLASMGGVQRDSVSERLTQVVRALDIEHVVNARIHAERLNCSVESNLFSSEIEDLKKKAEERWRRLEELRRKSARFDELLSDGASVKAKRARIDISDGANSLPTVR